MALIAVSACDPAVDEAHGDDDVADEAAAVDETSLCRGIADEHPVTLEWQDLAKAGELRTGSPILHITNMGAHPVQARLKARFFTGAGQTTVDLGDVELAAGRAVNFPVDLAGVALDPEFSSQVVVSADLFHGEDRVVGRSAPGLFFHADPATRTLVAYGEDVLRTRHNGGDLGRRIIADADAERAHSVGRLVKVADDEASTDPSAKLGLDFTTPPAAAGTYTVCLRIPVTIDDETGKPGEIGGDGNWVARGIRIQWVKNPDGTSVAGFPAFASASSGCFSFSSTQSGNFTLGIQPWGQLTAGNELKVRTNEDGLFTYHGALELTEPSGIYNWPYSLTNPGMYAVFAYAIQSGFRGNYANVDLNVHCRGCDGTACSVSRMYNGGNDIDICPGNVHDQYVMGHEYGHSNMWKTITGPSGNCSYGGSGHGYRGIEHTSCAVSEGWGNFVTAAIWNTKVPGATEQLGWVSYSTAGAGMAKVDIEAGQGGCAAVAADATNFRQNYADNCFKTGALADPACSTGDCIGKATELDWMRTFWDIYYDTDLPGTPPTPAQLQTTMSEAGGWAATTAWHDIVDAISNTSMKQRFESAGDWNGASEP